ncbi:ESPR-type extended signal peptide-containing protein [Acinetobacter vivianii]|uniref:ESPR-type extended signal peptide-containing protein n=1 Tax=Acinetobacter vivianii TaxID=1776742 RepID=UPI0019053955|nr:ESPR-type extended signal peptide-containing protein [Acinetobacter vivianii]MBJ8484325.1 YadA-like family protein [Acinetobacter vivianii]
MNKIYRLVWNKSLSLWTVVSENARGVTKKRNVTTIQTVTELTSSSLQQNNKLLKLKPSLIALTISTVFLSTGAFAGANMGGGTSNQGSSTAISPTNDQCGSAGQATVNGMPNSVAIGCGSRVNQTNNQVQGIAQRRGGGSSEPYPDGTANHVPSAVAIGNKNVTGAGGGVAIGNANESNATFANVAIGQGNRAIGGGFGTALGIGNLTDGSSNVAIGVANRARGNTAIALGRQTYAEADFAIAQGNTATVAAGATGGIAMGNAATTKGVRGIAIGSGTGGANYDATTAANADGADSVAIGTGAKGTGDGSTAVGRQAIASGESSTAMGDKAKAEGNGDVAIGTNAYAKGPNNLSATAVGRNSHAEGEDALAVGNSAKATANYAGAFGNFAQASAQNAMAVGNSAKASGDFSSAFGNFSEAAGLQSVASGNRAKATADYSSAYGNLAEASGIQSTALGNGAKSTGLRSTAVGHVATASGADSVATGPNAQAIGDSTIATGNNAQAQGENDIAIGRDAATSSGTTDNIAIGHGVTTGDTGQNVAMGSGTTSANAASSEGGAVAIGRDQVARGDGAVAIGDPNNANGNGAVALGRNNTAAGNDDATEAANGAIAIGNENKAIGQGSVALGNASTAAEAGAIALGDSANAQAARGIALGSNAVATNADDVALGAGSVTSTATGDSFLTGIAAPSSVVSVGSAGNERRIQHLSDGAEDTDAVNVRQLKHVKGVVDEQGESTANALGGGSTYDPETGAVSNPNYNINGNDMNNVGDALAELDKGWTLQSNGENADAIKAGDTVDIGTADGEENLQVEKEGNNIKYSLNRDLKVDSVTAGDTVMNTDGMTIAGGPSVTKSGIDAGGNKITNVAEGTEGTDAVNKDQLDSATTAAKTEVEAGKNMTVESETGADGQTIYTVATADDVEFDSVKVGDVSIDGATGKITGVTAGDVNPDSTDAINGSQLAGTAQSVSDALGGGSTVNPDGTVTAPNYNINGTDVNNVGDALAELDKGWTLQSNGENADAIKAGDTVDIGTADGEENLQVTKEGNDIKYSLNRDLKVDSVTAGDTVMNTDGMTIAGGPSVTKSGIDAGGNKITNVAEGTEGTDAVNKDQLDRETAAAKTEVEAGKNMTVESETGADGQTIYTVATADDVEFDSVKVGDVSIDGATGKITGVTAGDVNPDSTDAINGSQLAGTAQSVSDALGGGSTVNPDGTVTAPNYSVNGTDVNNVGDAIAELDKGWTLQSNGENAAAVKAGDTVDIGTADGEENLQVAKEGNNIKYSLNRDLKVDSVTAGDTVINNEGLTIAGGPSVTKDGIDAAGNKITNVADGEVAAGSKDAVNGGQLNDSVGSVGDMLGGGVTNEGGKLNGPFTVNDNGYANVADAIEGETAAAKTEVEAGKNMTVESETGANGQTIYTVATADDVEFDSVKVGDVSIDGATGKITGVTAGDVNPDSTDAINGSQLAGTAQSVSDALGGGSTVNPDGTVTAPNYMVNGTDVNNVGDAIAELDKGWTLQSNGENAAAVKAGDTVDIGTADGEENLQVTKDGNDIKYSLNRDLNVDSVTAGDSVMNTDGLTIAGGPSVTKDGIDAAGNKITNVADGEVAAGSKDAVNGGQLNDSVGSVGDMLGGGVTNEGGKLNGPFTVNDNGYANVADAIEGETAAAKTEVEAGKNMTVESETGANGQTIYTVATADDVEFNTVKVGDVSIDGATGKITGVTAGDVNPDSTDAINGSQLAGTAQSVSDALGGGSTVNPDGTVTAPNYTVNGDSVNNVGDAITALDKGWTLQSNGENAAAVKAGDTVDIGTADGEENLQVAKEGNDIKYSLNRDLKVDSVTAGDTVMNTDGMTIAGGPSVTKDGIDAGGNKITNVAPGAVSPDSTDAINGSQLNAQGEGVRDIIGGDTVYDPETGRYTNPNIGGTGQDNINDAIGSIGQAAREAKTTVSEGENIVVTESKNADGSTNYEVATARDVNFDSVQVGDVNIDGATGKISGVTAGDVNPDSTDAINGSQLAGTAQSVSDALGGGSTVNPDGTVTAPNYTVNGSDVNNVGDAITALDKGWTLQSNGANAGAVKAGDTVDIGTADGEENLQVTKDGNDIKYSLNRDLKVDSVTAGNTRLDNSGVEVKDAVGNSTTMVAGGTIVKDAQGNSTATTAAGTTIKDAQGNSTILNGTGLAFTDASGAPVGPSVSRTGIDAGGEKITNVADGEVAAGSKDAVNGGQLNDSVGSVGDMLGGGVTNEGGKLNGPFTVNDNGYANVADAIEGETAAAKTEVEAGKNMTVESETGANGQTIYTVATADDVEFDSVKVGDVNIDGATGKISGVTAGTVSADSTDAINGSQLHAQGEGVKDIIGGDTAYDPNTGRYTNPDIGGTGKDNINDAIGAVGAAATKAKTTVTEGDNIVVTESTNADGSTNYEVATAKDLVVDSVTAGDTVVNTDGLTIAGGPSVTKEGINAGDKKITGVAAGDVNPDSTDAINGSQLAGTAQSVSDALGGGSTVNPDGTVTAPNYTVNGDSVNNVGDAITALDKGWTLQSNGENAAAVKAGDTVDIGTADDEENLQVSKEGNDIKYSLNRDLKVDSVTAGDTVVNTDGLTIAGGPSVTKEGIDAGGKKLTNVAPGTVSPDSTDAINGSQLHAQGEGVKNIIGGNTTYDPNTGRYTNPNIGGTGKDNINDAIGAVGDAAKAAKTTVTEGDNIVVSETKNADGSTNYEVATAKDVKFDSVTSTDDEGNETVLTAKGTQVKDGEGNEAEYGAKGITLQDKDGNGTILNQGGLSFVDPMGNNIGPSITAGGINAGNTVIGGVAAGRVAADSQDAINGGQLRGVSDSVRDAIGGNTKVNDDGTITTGNVGNTGKDNVHDAIDSVRDAAEKAKSTVSEGKNIVVKESTNDDGSTNYEVSTSPDMEVDSITAGDTRVDGDGLHIEGGPSVTKDGIDAGDKKITGVEDGTIAEGSKDAINGGQMDEIMGSVAGAIGGNTTVNEDGTINTKDVGGTGYDTIDEAIASVKKDAKGAKSTVSEGDENVTVKTKQNADGSTDYEVGLAEKIKVKEVEADQVNAGQVNVKGDNGSTTITGDGVSVTGPNGEKGPSMTTDGINAGGKKVKGVADGRIEKGSQEAINGGQLHQSYEDVGAALGGGAGYDPEKGWKGPSYNVAGGSYNNVGDALGAIDDRVTNLSDQMQQAFYDTNQRIDDVKKHANAGIAAAMALEAAPYLAGKYTYAVGAAYHGGENAVGVTLRKTADNGRWSLSGGVAAASQGDPSFRVGLSGSFD